MYLPLQLNIVAEFHCESGSTDFEILCKERPLDMGAFSLDAARAARLNTPSGTQGKSVRFVITRSEGFFARTFAVKLDGDEVELCLFALTRGGMNVWWRKVPGASSCMLDSWISPSAEELGMHGENVHEVVMVTSGGKRVHVHLKYQVAPVA